MARKAIREYDAKRLLAQYLPEYAKGKFSYPGRIVSVGPETDMKKLISENPWLGTDKLVVKVDQLVGKRMKNDLVLLNADFEEVTKFIQEKMNSTVVVGDLEGVLTHFLIEPFVPHEREYFVAIRATREGDIINFSTEGGIDIEEKWESVVSIEIPILESIEKIDISGRLPSELSGQVSELFNEFLKALYRLYGDLGFTYLEINPLVLNNSTFIPLDLKARLDDTAAFEMAGKWGNLEFPAPFGRALTPEEQYVNDLDETTGASLKLTILNPDGRVWLLVAGGGASVVYTDTVSDFGFSNELANYGEYSGNPDEEHTYLYAKTIIDLMTRQSDPRGRDKILLIGGGIANFTDVAQTFKGIIRSLKEAKQKLQATGVRIYVRRGGPNYEEGLKLMRQLGKELGVPIQVYGPETHMTKIVSLALKE
ncbi:MAG: ATP citrate lyase citrate-binding domain-containing protein [Candidatus Hodarchaeota archaeon]